MQHGHPEVLSGPNLYLGDLVVDHTKDQLHIYISQKALTRQVEHVGSSLCPEALSLQLTFDWNGDDPWRQRQNNLCRQLEM